MNLRSVLSFSLGCYRIPQTFLVIHLQGGSVHFCNCCSLSKSRLVLLHLLATQRTPNCSDLPLSCWSLPQLLVVPWHVSCHPNILISCWKKCWQLMRQILLLLFRLVLCPVRSFSFSWETSSGFIFFFYSLPFQHVWSSESRSVKDSTCPPVLFSWMVCFTVSMNVSSLFSGLYIHFMASISLLMSLVLSLLWLCSCPPGAIQ